MTQNGNPLGTIDVFQAEGNSSGLGGLGAIMLINVSLQLVTGALYKSKLQLCIPNSLHCLPSLGWILVDSMEINDWKLILCASRVRCLQVLRWSNEDPRNLGSPKSSSSQKNGLRRNCGENGYILVLVPLQALARVVTGDAKKGKQMKTKKRKERSHPYQIDILQQVANLP